MKDKQVRLSHLARYEIRALKSVLRPNEVGAIRDALQDSVSVRNIYGLIANHHNSERAIQLIKLCAPIIYPASSVENLQHSIETWTKKVFMLDYGEEPKDKVRLFWSALEMVFLRATFPEILGVCSYLVGESENLIRFQPELWDFQGIEQVTSVEVD